jgi:hypothetical protein
MLSRRISPIRLPFISDANKSPTAKAAAKTTRPIRRLVRPTGTTRAGAAESMRALVEELVNCVAQNGGLIRQTCRAVQTDHKH